MSEHVSFSISNSLHLLEMILFPLLRQLLQHKMHALYAELEFVPAITVRMVCLPQGLVAVMIDCSCRDLVHLTQTVLTLWDKP